MLILSSCRFAALLALSFGLAAVTRAEPAMIAKARAYLGSEAALQAVKSVHYTGSMLAPNAADATKPISVGVDIIFQAPYRQRTVRTTSSAVDTSALDDYDGWQKVQDGKDATRWRLQLLPSDQIKRQRAIVWENLAFYRGLDRAGGSVIDQGPATISGISCRKIAFIHAPDIIFYRYFAEANGRLILTETENGSSIREQGEMMVQGLRFPRKIINSIKTADGKEQTVTITFDTITVNESFPASHFAIPSFSR
jgi:outer membrane lipoprotein-sorting protein